MVLSTHEMRLQLAPHCTVKAHAGAQDAWDAQQMVMRFYGYLLRAADTGSRNCREITGNQRPADDPDSWSLHAYFIDCVIRLWNLAKAIAAAAALDSNWNTNPYGPKLITDRPRAMCDDIEAIRTVNGKQVFRWGGHYAGNKDSMHDELVCAMADLATGIDWSTVRGHPSHPDSTPVQEDDMTPAQEAKLDAVLALLAGQPATGGYEYRQDIGDLNYPVVLPNGDLVQLVVHGEGEVRVLAHGCIPGPVGVVREAAGTPGRVDYIAPYVDGGFVVVTYDDGKGRLPGGARSADFCRPKKG